MPGLPLKNAKLGFVRVGRSSHAAMASGGSNKVSVLSAGVCALKQCVKTSSFHLCEAVLLT